MMHSFVDPGDGLTSPVYALERAVHSGSSGGFGFEHGELSFDQLDEHSNRLANLLTEMGVRPGDRVLGLLGNQAETLIAWIAASKLGAVWVPTNTGYRGEWLRWQVADSEPRLVIAATEYLERLSSVAEAIPARCPVLYTGPEPVGDHGLPGLAPLAAYLGMDDACPAYRPRPADLCLLMYTSGTTGRSKGCMISHNYLCNQARLGLLNLPRSPDEVYYTPLPLFHTAATEIAVATLLCGGSAYFAARFSVSRFWSDILRSGARACTLLGSMFAMLGHAEPSADMAKAYGQLHSVAGGPFPPELQTLWRERFGVTTTRGGVLGLTESHYICTTIGREERPGSCGSPTEDSYDVRIFDEADGELSQGQVGQIVVRPRRPHVMFDGYWRNPEATAKAFRNLWFHTGDYGYLDRDGYLFFSDRGNDRLRHGGENISSYELELALSHPDLSEITVHAVPSSLGEDEVKVVAVRKAGARLSEEDLCRWAATLVPRFTVPRYVEFRAELPRTPTGKVRKSVLRGEGITEATWDRTAHDITVPR